VCFYSVGYYAFCCVPPKCKIQNVTEFWEMDPNHTFIFDYISHHHMNSIMLSNIFLGFMWTSKLKLSRRSKKYSKNTTKLYEISLNTPRNTPNYMCDLDPLSKVWSQMYVGCNGFPFQSSVRS